MESVIKTAICEVLDDLSIDEVSFTVEHPSDLSHGDYATNVAMVVAKQVGKNPRELAEDIASKLEGRIEYVNKIEVAGPGFINFYLHRDFFVGEVNRSVFAGSDWGNNSSWQDKIVLVEYTDPNPFKEFHIGHLFTNAVGESIARLFMSAGADVRRVNYQGDVGLHVACSIYGMQQLGINADSDFTAKDLGKAYALGATANKNDEEASAKIKQINQAVYTRSDEEINSLYDSGRKVSLDYFETIYEQVGTKFDHYFFESEAAPLGKKLVEDNGDIFTESDGARVFKGEEYGLHSRVFLNSQGLPTYEAKELALAKIKTDYVDYDYSVISTANEINEYFKVLLKAMEFVYPDLSNKTEHIGHGMVRLKSGKMSSRTGDVITAVDFINEITEAATAKMEESGFESDGSIDESRLAKDIAIGAIKYATLKGSIYQDTIFDKDQALSFEGASGPYLQYTYARILSVIKKAEAAGVTSELGSESVPDEPYEIEKILYRFPEVVLSALEEREPHKVATFLLELASTYNTFYAHERIADVEDKHAPYKVVVSQAVAQTLKNGLWILGIQAPEKM